jgi:hypothetical protein
VPQTWLPYVMVGGEEAKGEGDLSMVRPLKRLFSERLPALKV